MNLNESSKSQITLCKTSLHETVDSLITINYKEIDFISSRFNSLWLLKQCMKYKFGISHFLRVIIYL